MFGEHTTTVLVGTALGLLSLTYGLLLWKTKCFRGKKDRAWYLAGIFAILAAVTIDFSYHLMVSCGLTPAPAIHAAVAPLLLLGVYIRIAKWRTYRNEKDLV